MILAAGTGKTVAGDLAYNANYWLNSLAIMTNPVKSGIQIDQNGIPSIFANTSAVGSFIGGYPGAVGTRGIVRGPGFFNNDMSVSKYFQLPKEGHRIQVRAEAFNAFNNVNFTNPSLALYSPLTFGEYQNTTAPRVMQFALRYEF